MSHSRSSSGGKEPGPKDTASKRPPLFLYHFPIEEDAETLALITRFALVPPDLDEALPIAWLTPTGT
jgi:hypothetical protein